MLPNMLCFFCKNKSANIHSLAASKVGNVPYVCIKKIKNEMC